MAAAAATASREEKHAALTQARGEATVRAGTGRWEDENSAEAALASRKIAEI